MSGKSPEKDLEKLSEIIANDKREKSLDFNDLSIRDYIFPKNSAPINTLILCHFENSIFKNTIVENAKLTNCTFKFCSFSHVNFNQSKLYNTKFSNCTFTNCNLDYCFMDTSIFHACFFENCSFKMTELDLADITKSRFLSCRNFLATTDIKSNNIIDESLNVAAIHTSPYEFILYKTERNELIMDAEIGSMAAYSILFFLDEQEQKEYDKNGLTYIKQMHSDMLNEPEKWFKRNRKITLNIL